VLQTEAGECLLLCIAQLCLMMVYFQQQSGNPQDNNNKVDLYAQRTFLSWCQLECNAFPDFDIHQYILLAILTTFCVTNRNDFIVYNKKLSAVECWTGTDRIRHYWCCPELSVEVAGVDLVAERHNFFLSRKWFYDESRGTPRDMKDPSGCDDAKHRTKNFLDADALWTLSRGPQPPPAARSINNRNSLHLAHNNIANTPSPDVVASVFPEQLPPRSLRVAAMAAAAKLEQQQQDIHAANIAKERSASRTATKKLSEQAEVKSLQKQLRLQVMETEKQAAAMLKYKADHVVMQQSTPVLPAAAKGRNNNTAAKKRSNTTAIEISSDVDCNSDASSSRGYSPPPRKKNKVTNTTRDVSLSSLQKGVEQQRYYDDEYHRDRIRRRDELQQKADIEEARLDSEHNRAMAARRLKMQEMFDSGIIVIFAPLIIVVPYRMY